jgi:pimeloyl-ACP methyl ester carboxylesterase
MAKLLIVIFSLIALCAAAEDKFYSAKYVPEPAYTPSINLFNGSYFPPVDHFSPQDNRTVQFHYRLNLDYYHVDGPIFIFVNGLEGTTTRWIESGLVVDVAREVGAALVTADHRYMGLNIPTETATFEDMRFLSVDQAVADIAVFVETMLDHLGKIDATNVILWGTGYGAAISVFARARYPHLIDAVFSSSGTFRAEVFDTSYHDNLSANIQYHGSYECHARVKNAFEVLKYLFENNQGDYIRERLRLCNDVNPQSPQEVGLLFELFIDLISHYIRQHQLYGMENFCRDMDYYPGDTLNSLIRWGIYAYSYDLVDCIDTNYPQLIQRVSQTAWEGHPEPRLRAYAYLRCSQIAAFRTTSEYYGSAFPSLLDAEYHFNFCEDIFGPNYNRHALEPATRRLNTQFGGQEQVVPFVIFTNAGLDPWVGHGVSEYDAEHGAVIFLYYQVAGADLTSITGTDPIELTLAKRQIHDTLVEWSARR